MNRCRTCGDRYPDAGDGWEGECGDCADRTYIAEEQAEARDDLRETVVRTILDAIHEHESSLFDPNGLSPQGAADKILAAFDEYVQEQ